VMVGRQRQVLTPLPVCGTPRLSLLAPPHASGELTPGVILWAALVGWEWVGVVAYGMRHECVGVAACGMGHSIGMLFGEYIVAECWFGPTLSSLYKAVPKEVQVCADTGWPPHPFAPCVVLV